MPFKCLRGDPNKIVRINKPSVCHIKDTLRPYMFERTQRLVIDINAEAQSVELTTPGEEVLGSIPTLFWLRRC